MGVDMVMAKRDWLAVENCKLKGSGIGGHFGSVMRGCSGLRGGSGTLGGHGVAHERWWK